MTRRFKFGGLGHRGKAITWAIATSLGSKVGTALLQLIAVPIALKTLGAREFGFFATISLGISWIGLLQLGVGPALAHGISKARASASHGESKSSEREYFTASFYLLPALAFFGAIACGMIIQLVPAGTLFGSDYAGAEEVLRPAGWLGVAIIGLQIALSGTERARDGYLEAHVNNLWGALGNFVAAGMLIFGVAYFPHVEFLMFAVLGCPALAKVANTIHLLIQRPYLLPQAGAFRRAVARELLSDGVVYSISISLPTLAQSTCMMFAVARLGGPEAAAEYYILMQLCVQLLGVVMMVTTPTWPAVADAKARGDAGWIRSAAKRVLGFSLAWGLAAWAGLSLLGPWLVPIWLKGEVVISRVDLVAFGAFFVAHAWAHANHMLLIGMGKVRASMNFCILLALAMLVPGTLGMLWLGCPVFSGGWSRRRYALMDGFFPPCSPAASANWTP
ncbi:MAG: hypothetical protein R3F11_04405 [Verrucomicrobiales bacterium]